MHTGLKVGAFAAVLAAVFGTAYGVGAAVDPVVSQTGTAKHGGHGPRAAKAPGGLQVAERGYTLDLKTPRLKAGVPAELRFAVVEDSTSRPVTAYARGHGKELHLIVASRDLTVYRHLHPERAADGTWSAPVELPEAGGYRVFADFSPKGAKEGLTLGSDLAATGPYEAAELPKPATEALVDGYRVRLEGELTPGRPSDLTLGVTKDGRPVRDLQPYLGAYGHLVALRSGDLAYLHVHPNGEPGDGRTKPGPDVSFTATAPSKGRYRLFLDFRHEGTVRTAAFTVATADGAAAKDKEAADGHQAENGHRH
ncbi:hypothetical protein [Streptomyces sp. NPDC053427]|uniref:hypothetical protein n=1 Tax=Streptomyces sp. NPDC053427 TaxID=3365701 RepID=UPI0037D29707